jgi:threonylcarbamoyladenosine tRNA methylthiotransferase MtaB
VLIESDSIGRTEHFTPVRVNHTNEAGEIVELRIAGHDGRHLIAA